MWAPLPIQGISQGPIFLRGPVDSHLLTMPLPSSYQALASLTSPGVCGWDAGLASPPTRQLVLPVEVPTRLPCQFYHLPSPFPTPSSWQ